MTTPALTMAVVVVSYRRAVLLANCLSALARQDRLPDRIVVAGVSDDGETRDAVEDFARASGLSCAWVAVPAPSVTAQTNLGVVGCDCDVLAFTNDDAEPFADWLARLEAYFADPTIGGVGGRDYIHSADGSVSNGPANHVGAITWFGRHSGNHHLSYPHVVDVEILKGVNMSCRRSLYRPLDTRLTQGGQRHWELDLCLGIRAAGYRLLFDPDICVDHYHFGASRPQLASPEYVYANAHNLTFCGAKHRTGWRRAAFIAYDLLWGDYPEMGLAVFLRTYWQRVRREGDWAFAALLPVALRAKRDALRALAGGRIA